ncbi:MAG: nucleotidyl transferase AbiEii/AbiGii toxin family protein [Verrucomicrobia bacterium]|nr:nucleotidyl transferase AbiEii/AbiGii toxin family protein [Verrucomicrobiota bacterium]
MPQENLFEFIGRDFSAAGIRWLLVGGFAVNFHGVSRYTADLDLLVTDAAYPMIFAILQKIGYREFHRQESFARLRSENLYLMDIDMLFVDDRTFEKMWEVSCAATVKNSSVRVPTIQHLFAMKLHALKYGHAGRQRKDLDDVRDLAAVCQLDLCSDEFRELCRRFADDKVYQLITGN